MASISTVSNAVSAELRDVLKQRRLSQATISRVLGVSQPQVSARLSGKVAWTVEELVTVAEYLGLDPAALIKAGTQ